MLQGNREENDILYRAYMFMIRYKKSMYVLVPDLIDFW